MEVKLFDLSVGLWEGIGNCLLLLEQCVQN